ncbi:hypothetical protein ACFFGR_15130 [Arthrobacter liuii]|uniref:Uncharacterized protein n=1 Tax=Arthrobacter liuii TaxID=1476996 RepID=A0ABQ2AVY5_9MICC|nr:hypothetical protein [Arthrobacter liuii]GGH99499.1 hypothetical protein GCM10007170_34480 [Arthrobacter liuii]
MVSKPLDLSGLTMPDDVKSKFPDGGAGVPQALEKYIAAATYPELQKGSHLNTVADYPLFENLRPLTRDCPINGVWGPAVFISGRFFRTGQRR